MDPSTPGVPTSTCHASSVPGRVRLVASRLLGEPAAPEAPDEPVPVAKRELILSVPARRSCTSIAMSRSSSAGAQIDRAAEDVRLLPVDDAREPPDRRLRDRQRFGRPVIGWDPDVTSQSSGIVRPTSPSA